MPVASFEKFTAAAAVLLYLRRAKQNTTPSHRGESFLFFDTPRSMRENLPALFETRGAAASWLSALLVWLGN